jgi:hypothetical protein
MSPYSNLISVVEAASQLNVHPSRVRAMAHAQQLNAEKIAGRWLIDQASIDHRQESVVVNGRPFDSANAWALLSIAAGHSVDWLSPSALSRLRGKLRNRGLSGLAPRLRARAQPMYLRAHPSVLDRIASEPGVVKAGVSAAAASGIDIQSSDELEAYVSRGRVDSIVVKYHLEPSDRPNVVLRVVADDDPFHWQGRVGPAIAAIDLYESRDPRSRRAAKQFLERFDAERHHHGR